jgi:polyhydroxyalkanoate synthesis repressor PhaR
MPSSAEETEHAARVRLIKRYGNRKLYDVKRSRYITLEGVRALVQQGEDVRVIDNDSGEDLTGVTFAQIIYEEAKRSNGGRPSLPLMRWLIQRGDEAFRDVMRSVERGREALESVREAAERGVQRLVPNTGAKPGSGTKKSKTLLEDLIEVPTRRFDELQHRIDSQVRQSVERFTKHPALKSEIQRVERSIREIEKRLGRLTQREAAAPRAGKPSRTKSVHKKTKK